MNDYSLEKLARGESALTQYGQVFGSQLLEDHSETRKIGPRNAEQIWEQAVYSRDRGFTVGVLEGNDQYLFQITKKMDQESPNERYTTIFYQHCTAEELKQFRYEDPLTGYTYRFSLNENGQPKIERYNHNASYLSGSYWKWENVTASVDRSATDTRMGFRENTDDTNEATSIRDNIPAPTQINTPNC